MNCMNSRWIWVLLVLLASLVGCGEEPVVRRSTPIRINELNPDNPVYQDMVGDTDDWIELYNPTDEEFQLEGSYISDSANKRFKDQFIAGTVIPANGVLLVWADAELTQSSARAPHVSFKLSATGEGVWLSNPDGYVIDSVDFGKMPMDPSGEEWTSLARFPDGAGPFVWCTESTPDELNGSGCGGEIL
jgi:hypothetical protein